MYMQSMHALDQVDVEDHFEQKLNENASTHIDAWTLLWKSCFNCSTDGLFLNSIQSVTEIILSSEKKNINSYIIYVVSSWAQHARIDIIIDKSHSLTVCTQ